MVSINLGEFMLNLFKSKRLLSSTLLASVLAGSLITSGCTNPTSTAGKVSYFTEGVITSLMFEFSCSDQIKMNIFNGCGI